MCFRPESVFACWVEFVMLFSGTSMRVSQHWKRQAQSNDRIQLPASHSSCILILAGSGVASLTLALWYQYKKLQRVWLINLARRRSNASKYYNERPNMFRLQVKKLILSYSHSRPRRRNNCDIQWRILGTPGERHGRSCSCESSELKQQQTFCILLFVRS